MQTYIGTKLIKSVAMNRLDYNIYRGWELPADEDGSDEGYLVEYLDGGKPNHPDHEGDISWSPKEQHENAYRRTDGMSFGLAIEALKKGFKVAREGWNGKGMSLVYVRDSTVENYGPQCLDNPYIYYLAYIQMCTIDNRLVPWLASQTDMLEDDWVIVE